jgi:hypothetical protein
MLSAGETGGGWGERSAGEGIDRGRRGCGFCPGLKNCLLPGDVLSPLGVGVRGLSIHGLLAGAGGNVHGKKLLLWGRVDRGGEKILVVLVDDQGLTRINII